MAVLYKFSKWYRSLRACNPNKKIRKNKRVPHTSRLKKGRRKEERLSFPKPKIEERKEEDSP